MDGEGTYAGPDIIDLTTINKLTLGIERGEATPGDMRKELTAAGRSCRGR